MVAIRIFGLAWRVETHEVADFFKDYKMVADSAILGVGEDGRNNGLGAVLMETAEEAEKASKELDK